MNKSNGTDKRGDLEIDDWNNLPLQHHSNGETVSVHGQLKIMIQTHDTLCRDFTCQHATSDQELELSSVTELFQSLDQSSGTPSLSPSGQPTTFTRSNVY